MMKKAKKDTELKIPAAIFNIFYPMDSRIVFDTNWIFIFNGFKKNKIKVRRELNLYYFQINVLQLLLH